MNQSYDDIVSRLGQPLWWDEVGCPRYEPFAPNLLNCIYSNEAILLEIECQGCGQVFNVGMGFSTLDMITNPRLPSMKDRIVDKSIHYGDPPNSGCCASGPTMNCIDRRVIQYWKRVQCVWERDAEFEVTIEEKDES